jgi:guanylate kinase
MTALKPGNIFVLSAPSGAGKTTVATALLRKDKLIRRVVTVTTRTMRPGEKQGRDYRFVGHARFKEMIAGRAFAEYACVHGEYYGTPKSGINAFLNKGYDVLLVIDIQGGMNIRKRYPGARLIFLKPPSMKELSARLRGRGSDAEHIIQKRLMNARREMRCAERYDVCVVNKVVGDAVKRIAQFIAHERRKGRHICQRD